MVTTATKPFPPLAIRAQLRWDVVRGLVESVHPALTIEIGVGQGAMSARIASITTGVFTGFEIDESSFGIAAPRVSEFGGTVYNELLSADRVGPADLVCAFEVLEHLEDDLAAVREWTNFIKPGGFLVLSVPFNPDRFGPMDKNVGHFRRYSIEAVTEVLVRAGLTDVAVTLYGAPLGYALEAVRNRIDSRKMRRLEATDHTLLDPQTLTGASGRTFQFERNSWKSTLARTGTLPFQYLQHVWPGGIGLVAIASKPQ